MRGQASSSGPGARKTVTLALDSRAALHAWGIGRGGGAATRAVGGEVERAPERQHEDAVDRVPRVARRSVAGRSLDEARVRRDAALHGGPTARGPHRHVGLSHPRAVGRAAPRARSRTSPWRTHVAWHTDAVCAPSSWKSDARHSSGADQIDAPRADAQLAAIEHDRLAARVRQVHALGRRRAAPADRRRAASRRRPRRGAASSSVRRSLAAAVTARSSTHGAADASSALSTRGRQIARRSRAGEREEQRRAIRRSRGR